jgi:hypothetical protein
MEQQLGKNKLKFGFVPFSFPVNRLEQSVKEHLEQKRLADPCISAWHPLWIIGFSLMRIHSAKMDEDDGKPVIRVLNRIRQVAGTHQKASSSFDGIAVSVDDHAASA